MREQLDKENSQCKRVERRRTKDLREEVGTNIVKSKIVKSRIKLAKHMVGMKDEREKI